MQGQAVQTGVDTVGLHLYRNSLITFIRQVVFGSLGLDQEVVDSRDQALRCRRACWSVGKPGDAAIA